MSQRKENWRKVNLMPDPIIFPIGVEAYEFSGPLFHLRNFDNKSTSGGIRFVLEVPNPNDVAQPFDIEADIAFYTPNGQFRKRYNYDDAGVKKTAPDDWLLLIESGDSNFIESRLVEDDGNEMLETDWFIKPILAIDSIDGTFAHPEHVHVKFYAIFEEDKV